jgi:peptide/nickel transport system permease protein
MLMYLLRRLLAALPVLALVAVVSFVVLHLIPGDPATVLLGTDATPERVALMRQDMGLDEPLPVQFAVWVAHVLRGDLGRSWFLGRPVTSALLERLPPTMLLAVASLLVAVLVGVPAGLWAAVRQNTGWDRALMMLALGGVSVPSFWLGLALILVFGVKLGWLPTGGYVAPSDDLRGALTHLVLPAISLGVAQAALIARITRSAMLDVLRQDWVRTARAKGLHEPGVILGHALRNSLVQVITVVGLAFGILLGGAVIVETVFTYPGLGRLVVVAVQRRDYLVVQGALLLVATLYVLVNLAADLLYGVVDPRLRG